MYWCRPWARSPGLALHANWGSSALAFPIGGSERDGHLSGTTQLAKGPIQVLETESRSPSVYPGRWQRSQAAGQMRTPQVLQGTLRSMPPLGGSAVAPQPWASRGMPGLVVRGRLRRPTRRGSRTPTPKRPRAARIAPSQRFKGVLNTPRRPRGRGRDRPPAGKEPKRPAACPGTHRLCRAVCRPC